MKIQTCFSGELLKVPWPLVSYMGT